MAGSLTVVTGIGESVDSAARRYARESSAEYVHLAEYSIQAHKMYVDPYSKMNRDSLYGLFSNDTESVLAFGCSALIGDLQKVQSPVIVRAHASSYRDGLPTEYRLLALELLHPGSFITLRADPKSIRDTMVLQAENASAGDIDAYSHNKSIASMGREVYLSTLLRDVARWQDQEESRTAKWAQLCGVSHRVYDIGAGGLL